MDKLAIYIAFLLFLLPPFCFAGELLAPSPPKSITRSHDSFAGLTIYEVDPAILEKHEGYNDALSITSLMYVIPDGNREGRFIALVSMYLREDRAAFSSAIDDKSTKIALALNAHTHMTNEACSGLPRGCYRMDLVMGLPQSGLILHNQEGSDYRIRVYSSEGNVTLTIAVAHIRKLLDGIQSKP